MAKDKNVAESKHGYRQEVFNVLLAQLLRERGIVSAPEDVLASPLGRRMPDVMVDFVGLRTVIEGEVADQPAAEERALNSAKRRVEQGIAHIGLGVVYPARLRQVDFADLKTQLASSDLQVAVVTEAGPSGYATTRVDGLAEILRGALDQLVKENVVAEAVAILEAGIETFAAAVGGPTGIVPRMAEVLGVRELPSPQQRKTSQPEEEGP